MRDIQLGHDIECLYQLPLVFEFSLTVASYINRRIRKDGITFNAVDVESIVWDMETSDDLGAKSINVYGRTPMARK